VTGDAEGKDNAKDNGGLSAEQQLFALGRQQHVFAKYSTSAHIRTGYKD
jgi:hypothetical protein